MPDLHGPIDEQMRLNASHTKTADFNGAAFDMGEGYAPPEPGQPVVAVIDTSALDTADANETYAFHLEESADGSTGWADIGVPVTVTAAGVKLAKGFATKRYVRLVCDVGGTTPSITYEAWLRPMRFSP